MGDVSTVVDGSIASGSDESAIPAQACNRRARERVLFWVRRYLPAEIAGTTAVIAVGLAAQSWWGSAIVTAAAATVAESVGFYAVVAVVVYREQRRVAARRRDATSRTALLLAAEFGPAELLDSLLARPVAIALAVWLIPDPLWALLVGKLAADLVFYSAAAGAFTITVRTGLRRGDRRAGARAS